MDLVIAASSIDTEGISFASCMCYLIPPRRLNSPRDGKRHRLARCSRKSRWAEATDPSGRFRLSRIGRCSPRIC